jgi:preprotein translocase subunit SecY
METLVSIFRIPDLRRKIVFSMLILALFRAGSHIPISGIDLEALSNLFAQGGILGFVNLFSGGALGRFSIFALGIIPYINASIIMQLMTIIWPKIKEIQEEGESGRKQISQYTRYLAVCLSVVQGLVMSVGFRSLTMADVSFPFFVVYATVGLVAGAALVMWLGEVISERGIGNGASLLIFFGIVAQMPQYVGKTYVFLAGGDSSDIIRVLVFIGILILMIVGIVIIQEAQRRIPVQYAKRVVGKRTYGGQNTYIPLRLIQGGVLPIIFASAVLQFPMMFMNLIKHPIVTKIMSEYFDYTGLLYNGLFCVLIFFFTYFYTAITFNPEELADNIKKYGGFILGIRPGRPTVDYLETIIGKLTLIGATCLALIALVPIVAQNLTGVNSFRGLGGTALLIIVGVAMDLVKQIETYLINRRYEGVLNG